MEASGDSSWSCVRRIIRGPSQRFWEPCSCLERAWEVGHPGAHGGQTPSLLCLRVVQRHRARAPTGFGIKEPGPQQTCSLRPLSLFCSKSNQSTLTEHCHWVTSVKAAWPCSWRAQGPASVTLTGHTGTESSVHTRPGTALLRIIALHYTSH